MTKSLMVISFFIFLTLYSLASVANPLCTAVSCPNGNGNGLALGSDPLLVPDGAATLHNRKPQRIRNIIISRQVNHGSVTSVVSGLSITGTKGINRVMNNTINSIGIGNIVRNSIKL